VRKGVELLRYADPMLIVDGEIAADDAVSPEIIEQQYPFSALKGGANVLIFPDLASANLATKLLAKIGGGEVIGPILMGMSRPVHVLQRTATVEEIVNVSAIAVVDAQESDTTCTCRSSPAGRRRLIDGPSRLVTTKRVDFSFQQQRNFAAVFTKPLVRVIWLTAESFEAA
jgi:hypothetical protein